jgi:predicted acetyltransferase
LNFELIYAPQDLQPIIQNLARFYIYDLSEYQKRPCPSDGLYVDEDYSRYWEKSGHHPFLIKAQGELAGFAFIEEGGSTPEVDYQIAEFFILRKFRGEGLGCTTAQELFSRYPGRWEVMALINNCPAIKFWEKVISEYAQGNYTKSPEFHETEMIVFRFSSQG